MKAVGIRELKDRLSRYLDEVRHGEVLLVTDRGRVVAEIRQPGAEATLSLFDRRLANAVSEGAVSSALPKDATLYRKPSFSIDARRIDEALDAVRGDH
jgi:antitoxin (DNA-binding transcriptional repressor) of toxin-antitoxin stability system